MRATSGIFRWRADAERASRRLESIGLGRDRIALLVPGEGGRQLRRIPASTAEQSGVGKALGVATGAALVWQPDSECVRQSMPPLVASYP